MFKNFFKDPMIAVREFNAELNKALHNEAKEKQESDARNKLCQELIIKHLSPAT